MKPGFIARFIQEREPWPRDERGIRQLRHTLKRLLRTYGWRAVEIKPDVPVSEEELAEAST